MQAIGIHGAFASAAKIASRCRREDTGNPVVVDRSASDVVRAGLRLLEEHESKVKALQEALIEGERSGEPQFFDRDGFLKRIHDKHIGWGGIASIIPTCRKRS